ncbi:MAG: hypothetical protein ACLFQ5_04660 [Oceanicaulis sp.]
MRFQTLAVFAAALSLAGCQSVRDRLGEPEPNPGPCPNALALYDAHRLVQMNGDALVYENVGFTGEILNVVSRCRYTNQDASPIDMEVGVRLAFGRGPAADAETHTYELFVSVVAVDSVVLDKQVFPVTVRFRPGQDRVEVQEIFDSITIPRNAADTSGANYEVLVGFELTDEQLEFNREGLRFRVDAGQN